MFRGSDLHGFKLECCLPLSRLHESRSVAHRVAAVGSHVPGEVEEKVTLKGRRKNEEFKVEEDEEMTIKSFLLTNLVIMSLLQAEYGQDGHLYGFSPVCVRWWVDKWSLRENTCRRKGMQ